MAPNPAPVGRWRSAAQEGDAFKKEARWPVLLGGAQTALEVGLRLVPILLAIRGEAVREQLAQLALLRLEFADATHHLIDPDRFGLAGDGDEVELACLNDLLRQPIGPLAEDDRAAIDLVDALEARSEIHGVADHRIGLRRSRADGSDHCFA